MFNLPPLDPEAHTLPLYVLSFEFGGEGGYEYGYLQYVCLNSLTKERIISHMVLKRHSNFGTIILSSKGNTSQLVLTVPGEGGRGASF